ncbi:PIG-L family deacetylase [bacterium]|nr:PIG-L family deacetylase [bacterium]
MSEAFRRGAAFSAKASTYQRPFYLIPHQDDEVPSGGIIQRLGTHTQFVWTTNGDGLYFQSDLNPHDYGELRKAEAIKSVAALGIPEENTKCLDFSEVEIYRRMAGLHDHSMSISDVRGFFEDFRDKVRAEVFRVRPDALFTLAYQGGQPEHDLTHFFTRLAVQDYEKETGERVDFYNVPAYEYTILLALRFHPLYPGTRIRIRLTDEELERKMGMLEAYPSQQQLFADFEKVFRYTGLAARFIGRKITIEDFMRVEEFGPVPLGLDYTRPPHLFNYFSYMFDDFEGVPVTFKTSVLPIIKDFLPK